MTKTVRYLFLALALSANAQDWPMWRADASRSGATTQALPQELKLQWSRALPKPDPAFDYHFRLCADQSYEPVAAGGVVFLPSNVSDEVTAFDLATGAVKWRFETEGPVRFAPVVSGGRVWFVSDDGHLYCVDAANGSLKWKTRGAPSDRADFRMLVNGRLCSRWPARGGPLLKDGVLYFGCGLWPSEGVFAVAVAADSGKILWRNTEISQIDDGLEEHGKMADVGLPPHGYLAEIGDRIAMPSGRAIAAFLDPSTGKLDPYNSFYAKHYPVPRGSWAVVGGGDFWWQGGALFATSSKVLNSLPTGPLTLEETAELCGQDIAWVEKQIKAGTITVKTVKGQRRVMISPRSPALAFAVESRRKEATAGQIFQLEHRPVVNMPEISTRHEVDARTLPVFTRSLMIRSEFTKAMDNEIERGMTQVRPPQGDVIRAYEISEPSWTMLPAGGKAKAGASGMRRQLQFKTAWELKTPLIAKIVAGDQLYAAGENKIAAITIPAAGGKPAIAWEAKVDGYPVGVIAAGGRLVVTTDKGALYCFGADAGAAPLLAEKPVELPSDAAWKDRVTELLKNAPSAHGNALVLGWNSGGLARELVRQSALNVIVVEPDAALAAKARAEFAAAGLPGSRAQVIAGSATLRLPPYFAEVVASEDLGTDAIAWSTAALDALRPFTGQALIPMRPKLRDAAEAHAKALGGFTFESERGQWTRIARIATPTGADDWTHETASAGNTFASADKLAVPPFALLWYSGGIDRYFTPQWEYHHNRNPYPVISAGRMFLLAGNAVDAVDAFTGRHLWKTTVPPSAKAERRESDHRMFSRPADQNVIAAQDKLYVFRDADAQVLDAHTGEILATLALPEKDFGADAKALWDEVRVLDDTLFVAAGKWLVALDRHTGAVRWRRAGAQDRVAFALGEGRVFAVDYAVSRAAKPDAAGQFASNLVVLNAADGSAVWEAPLTALARDAQDTRIGKNTWAGIFADNALKPVLAWNAAHRIIVAVVDRHQYFAFDATGKPLWNKKMEATISALVGFEPPTVTSDFVIVDNQDVLDVRTGQPASVKQIGGRGTGCNRVVGSDALVTFRSALACVLDLATQKRTYLSSTRTGCSNGMIPAGGLLNSPNFAHGCVCNYPFLTSFALVHLPEAAKWAPANSPDVQFQRNPNTD